MAERADAARNRERVLAAAATVFAGRESRSVTMGEIAAAAGVGRATLYRRYPDIAAVATALLDQHERDLQEQLMRGAPPLGPGAPPVERMAAFYAAMVDLLDKHVHLVLGSETGRLRFETGAYGFWRAHVRSLLVAATTPDPDALVEPLLAPLAPDVFLYQRRDRRLSTRRIVASLTRLAHAALVHENCER